MRYKILQMLFISWVVLWAVFFVRELFVKGNIRDYGALLGKSLEDKHAYVTGDKLYSFLSYCKTVMPEGSTYEIAGLDEGDLESRRAVYYLYPRLKSKAPDFIIDCKEYRIRETNVGALREAPLHRT